MSNSTLACVGVLVTICLEQRLHPTETMEWVKRQVKTNWKGEQPAQLVMEAQRQLSGTAYL